ncbi:NAD-dependent succinate-semialdehyde dehydrogenase [Arenibacter sp. 6A1]|uniref:NAD-dependent succinate-semialdehyde dehydrogenase n=1 Tax=Arenibacter sp. 6A1 TaxID=2720391 RepID=UPI001445E67F|nr:NAD-dependent succinate-semialdehyde dehydrogenase [Arenibacter sp. 6A1]NKI25189.1 NAD-dependent succinate-semialdehyde dehydrogenase [Arenibacter sp. 6A1]
MKNTVKSINPFNNELLQEYKLFSDQQIAQVLQQTASSFSKWKKEPIDDRAKLLSKVGKLLELQKYKFAKLITQEMGKPLVQSIAEVEKCAWVCEFYAVNADDFLCDDLIETEARESFISYDPLGCILAIMPWNFPFWQVLRFAAPTLTAGNTVILKHAANVSGCAMALEQLFEEAGYPKGCFQVIIADHQQVESLIENTIVKAVTLTGSEKAGRHIAAIAGKNLKKTVLELGGNNACIVWEDADLDGHVKTMVNARMLNAGQSCIAAKRFIVVADIYEEFIAKFQQQVQLLHQGDPMDPETDISVLARPDLADIVAQQVTDSVAKGAEVLIGHKKDKAYYAPTILTKVTPDMPVFKEEVFGPVAAIIKAKDREESLALAANTAFGLGTMLFTQDLKAARHCIDQIEDGAFFINEMVKSDPRLPFGGTKASGYGRELSKEGILEFVNKKTVFLQ